MSGYSCTNASGMLTAARERPSSSSAVAALDRNGLAERRPAPRGHEQRVAREDIARRPGRQISGRPVLPTIVRPQPAAPSILETASTTWTTVAISASAPPSERGTHSRDKPARDMASTTGIASRRERSLSSAEASIRGASSSTLARNANVEVLFSGVLPETSVTFAP